MVIFCSRICFKQKFPLKSNHLPSVEKRYNSGEMRMSRTDTDGTEKEESQSASKSGRLAELKEDKAREARRWQRKRATIKRFASMK